MTALTNHTIDSALPNGYGRFGVLPVWISVSHDARRVVLFPYFSMDANRILNPFTCQHCKKTMEEAEQSWDNVAFCTSCVNKFIDAFPNLLEALNVVQDAFDWSDKNCDERNEADYDPVAKIVVEAIASAP